MRKIDKEAKGSQLCHSSCKSRKLAEVVKIGSRPDTPSVVGVMGCPVDVLTKGNVCGILKLGLISVRL